METAVGWWVGGDGGIDVLSGGSGERELGRAWEGRLEKRRGRTLGRDNGRLSIHDRSSWRKRRMGTRASSSHVNVLAQALDLVHHFLVVLFELDHEIDG
jgi:hypothetical protein